MFLVVPFVDAYLVTIIDDDKPRYDTGWQDYLPAAVMGLSLFLCRRYFCEPSPKTLLPLIGTLKEIMNLAWQEHGHTEKESNLHLMNS